MTATDRSQATEERAGVPMLDVRDLRVSYRGGERAMPAVRGVSFTLDRGQTLGIAGESGSGKSTMALSLLRLLPSSAEVSGQVLFEGEDLLTAKWARLRAVRWSAASVVFQGAMSALNPVRTIGEQICEPILLHDKIGQKAARARAAELLDSVGVPSRRLGSYPHEFSGGQRQRIMIAMALACRPDLIIADEPTTALDVMVQAQVLNLLGELVRESGIGVIMISHDLSVLSHMCERLAVMYAGQIAEIGPSKQLISEPRHPYTRALGRAFPTIGDPASRLAPAGLPGDPPTPSELAKLDESRGCAFEPRCPEAVDACRTETVELWPSGPGREAACLRVLEGSGA
ncbi:ABC transporter ATP-binding protein [Microtetraspora sp. NBRC 16547]|uniref:ABC transporter ATP-binding protein n=1 Tax=Microtetraspora sp. NBRC 16547 TaxID=3030993 RepID=UPI0024A235DC|nr:ABC transporter ATP-binding protein [Microtetraspora sp. NBRC 16547]GLX02545.1 dipeptide/oligopeptide/nickel ABC transporter ATP-binding protein [Microtetraspora sp. NBRC 16547]